VLQRKRIVAALGGLIAALCVPAATPVQAATVPALNHVFVIVMENHAYNQIIGSSAAPYTNSLLGSGALATNYYGVTHPSLPNYLALAGGSTYGITSDCTTCWVSAGNVGDSLEAAGKTWRAYQESMPSNCFVGDSYPYVQKHDPFIYFNDIRNNAIRCGSDIVPYSQLASDLASTSTTRSLSFITPNACNDMHDCSIQTGDWWLQQQVPHILASPAFTQQHSLLAITWDEDDFTTANHVPLILLGSGVGAGLRSGAAYNHYSLLHTIEGALGAAPITSNDANAPMISDLFTSTWPATCPMTMNLAPMQSNTSFSFSVAAGTCAVSYFDVQQSDTTLGQAPYALPSVGQAGIVAASGYQGHTYQFAARAHSGGGAVSSWAQGSTQVAATAVQAHPWLGLYTLDSYGGIHLADSPVLSNTPHFNSPLARAVKAAPGANAPQNGFVLDAYGGLHPYGSPSLPPGLAPYYPGNDIARDFVFAPTGAGGYELDGYGGIHPFTVGSNPMPPVPGNFPYFTGQDVAKKITLLPDGSGGYVLDAFGGLHPWSVAGHGLPVGIAGYGYWAGRNIARDVWLAPDSTASSGHGYVIDAYGGFHPFWSNGATVPAPMAVNGYWSGSDIARGMWFMPGSSASGARGYTLDAYGGLHPFAAAGQAQPQAISQYAYWSGQDIARAVFGA